MTTLWHVTIPVIGLVRADTPEEADAIVAARIERADLYPYEDGRRVMESDYDPDLDD